MQLSSVRDVYKHEGPFATVYLEARSPGEDSATQLRLRWSDLRDQLTRAGADAAALAAIEERVTGSEPGEGQADGRVLVADAEGLALERDWDASLGAGDTASWTVLPELGAYARESARTIRALVVLADKQGAVIRHELLTAEHRPDTLESEETTGDAQSGVHKPRGGALAHNRIQRKADEAASRNAGEIVDALRKASSVFQPRVIVLAGEVQGRTAVHEELTDELARLVTEIDKGGGDRHTTDGELADELAGIAERETTGVARSYAEEFGSALSQGNAVQGHENVGAAAELGAVSTLLFEDGTAATREDFLLKTCAETDADFQLLPAGTGLTDGVAALLRFPLPEQNADTNARNA